MNIIFADARSHDNGIDFIVRNKNIIIRAMRKQNGEVVIMKDKKNALNTIQLSIKEKIGILIGAVLFSLIYSVCTSWQAQILSFLMVFWLITLGHYYVNSKNPKNARTYRYHAAEHKALNYFDKYHKATNDCDELMKMSSISFRCGSTLIAVVLVFITLIVLGIVFIPFLSLKFIWCIVCVPITFFLWGKGKCDFLQKLVIKNPGRDEVEVATCGLREYAKEME